MPSSSICGLRSDRSRCSLEPTKLSAARGPRCCRYSILPIAHAVCLTSAIKRLFSTTSRDHTFAFPVCTSSSSFAVLRIEGWWFLNHSIVPCPVTITAHIPALLLYVNPPASRSPSFLRAAKPFPALTMHFPFFNHNFFVPSLVRS